VILILIVYCIAVGEINAMKEAEMKIVVSKVSVTDSLLKIKDKKLKKVDEKLDSVNTVNKNLVESVKGTISTMDKLLKGGKKISDEDRKEALKWLEQ